MPEFFIDTIDETVDPLLRLAVPWSRDAADSLLAFCKQFKVTVTIGAGRHGRIFGLPKGSTVDWDWHRLFRNGRGNLNRPRERTDLLLIDLADEAAWHGWPAPPDIAMWIERLRGQAEASQKGHYLDPEFVLGLWQGRIPGPTKPGDRPFIRL